MKFIFIFILLFFAFEVMIDLSLYDKYWQYALFAPLRDKGSAFAEKK